VAPEPPAVASAPPRPVPVDRVALRRAAEMAEHGAAAERATPAQAATAPTPVGYWVAVGSALALVTALLVLLLSGMLKGEGPGPVARGARPGPGTGPPPEPLPPAEAPRLPEPPVGDPRDEAEPTFLDGLEAGALDPLRDGVWLLVYSDPSTAEGRRTVATATAVHRKLRDSGARLALVLARQAFLDEEVGRLVAPEVARARLLALGARGDVTVILDAPDGPPTGGRLRARFGVKDLEAAVVIVDGRLEHRTAPASGGFTLPALEPLAVRAREIRPAPVDED